MTHLPVVDSRIHVWNPERLLYPWLAGVPALNRSFLPQDSASASASANAGEFIFVECGGKAAQRLDELNWISEIACPEPRPKGIVAQAAVETGDSIRGHLAALARNPLVKDARRIPHGESDPQFCLRLGLVSGVIALADFGLTFDLCWAHQRLPAAIELVRRCPDVQYILDHCGKPGLRDQRLDPRRRHLRELAALRNVACKIPGLVTEADPARWGAEQLRAYVAPALESFGIARVLFGGDWPVCNLTPPLGDRVRVLEEILAGENESDLAKLYQRSAERTYGLRNRPTEP